MAIVSPYDLVEQLLGKMKAAENNGNLTVGDVFLRAYRSTLSTSKRFAGIERANAACTAFLRAKASSDTTYVLPPEVQRYVKNREVDIARKVAAEKKRVENPLPSRVSTGRVLRDLSSQKP